MISNVADSFAPHVCVSDPVPSESPALVEFGKWERGRLSVRRGFDARVAPIVAAFAFPFVSSALGRSNVTGSAAAALVEAGSSSGRSKRAERPISPPSLFVVLRRKKDACSRALVLVLRRWCGGQFWRSVATPPHA